MVHQNADINTRGHNNIIIIVSFWQTQVAQTEMVPVLYPKDCQVTKTLLVNYFWVSVKGLGWISWQIILIWFWSHLLKGLFWWVREQSTWTLFCVSEAITFSLRLTQYFISIDMWQHAVDTRPQLYRLELVRKLEKNKLAAEMKCVIPSGAFEGDLRA